MAAMPERSWRPWMVSGCIYIYLHEFMTNW